MNSTNTNDIQYTREELERKLKERKKKFASVTTAFEKDLFSKMINHYESLIKKIDEDDEKKRKELVMKLKEYENLFNSVATMEFEKDYFRKAIDHYKSLIKKIDDKKGNANPGIENIPRCVICLDNSNKSYGFMFICGHSFHGDCVIQWLIENKTCPTCRTSISTQHIQYVNQINDVPVFYFS